MLSLIVGLLASQVCSHPILETLLPIFRLGAALAPAGR
jgi:hypothetical protein